MKLNSINQAQTQTDDAEFLTYFKQQQQHAIGEDLALRRQFYLEANLVSYLKALHVCIDSINRIEELLGQKINANLAKSIQNSMTLFQLELKNYRELFTYLRDLFARLNECVGAATSDMTAAKIQDDLIELESLIRTYRSENDLKLNFFQTLNLLIENSLKLTDRIFLAIRRLDESDAEAESSTLAASFIDCVDLNVMYEPYRCLSKLLYEKYSSCKQDFIVKCKQQQQESDSTNQAASKSSLVDLKQLELKDKHFYLEVLDDQLQSKHQQQHCLDLENFYVVNATYEALNRSFQPTLNKSIRQLRFVRLTPIVDAANNSEANNSGYKYVPLVNKSTNELICLLCIKYWHPKKISLSNSTATTTTTTTTTTTLTSNAAAAAVGGDIPINNPIYFCLNNSNCQSLLNFLKTKF
jgi:hypothetical protein